MAVARLVRRRDDPDGLRHLRGGALSPATGILMGAASRRVLDPVERASEILFGLIMVLTFTLSIPTTDPGGSDLRPILVGALGCNFAWGIIDAVMYLMGAWGERGLRASLISAIRQAGTSGEARALIADEVPALIRPAFADEDLDRIRRHLETLPPEDWQPSIRHHDFAGALGVFLLVFLCLFPVVLPFLLVADRALALRISNGVALVSLFLTGAAFGRHLGRPWQVGIVMTATGVVLVAIAMAFGG
jgi:hypothetical protein